MKLTREEAVSILELDAPPGGDWADAQWTATIKQQYKRLALRWWAGAAKG
jgi:hypothetical protein